MSTEALGRYSIILRLQGNFEVQGFWVTLEIISDSAGSVAEFSTHLPPSPDLAEYLYHWQDKYLLLENNTRIQPQGIIYEGSVQSRLKDCRQATENLSDYFIKWLESPSFLDLDKQLRTYLSNANLSRICIRSSNRQVQRLPWHLWDVMDRYPKAEVVLNPPSFNPPSQQLFPKSVHKVRVLAIIGNSEGIDVKTDGQELEALPDTDIQFLKEPTRQKLNDTLRSQPWDILFFAGHSQTEQNRGRIEINPYDSLTLGELKYALREAVNQGLQLAIFNSCDGLGLAWELEELNVPQLMVMREPVPDPVAQTFLKTFLKTFSSGQSLPVAMRRAREQLQGLEDKFPCASWLPILYQHPAVDSPTWQSLKQPPKPPRLPSQSPPHWSIALMTSLITTLLVTGLRLSGSLQLLEFQAYDHLMRSRPEEGIDSRLLVVEATEEDVNEYGFPLPDGILAEVIDKLNQHQPRVIGLDILRDRPIPPGHEKFLKQLQQQSNLVGICSIGQVNNPNFPGINPPPEVPETRLGFSDIWQDPDGILRRQGMFMSPDSERPCTTPFSFGTQIALKYLEQENIEPKNLSHNQVQIGKAIFSRLQPYGGAYQGFDNRGFQVMLNYRQNSQIAESISVSELLTQPIAPELIRDRIVLVGVTAPISNATDYFWTPLSAQQWPYQKIAGVKLQGQMVSHILSAALEGRTLIHPLPPWLDVLWIGSWGLMGSLVIVYRRGVLSIGFLIVTVSLLYGSCWILLLNGFWVPLIPGAIAIVGGSGLVWSYWRIWFIES